MGSSSRRPHRVPLRSDKNSTRRIQFTQTHQNWTIEDCKNVAWSDESWFLLRHSDVGSEFGVKNMEAWIILPCLNGSGCWWWCNGVGGIFLAHFGLLSTNWASFKLQSTWVLLLTTSISLWLQCTIFWCTSSRIMHHVTKLKSSQTGFLNMTMSSLYSNDLHSHQISIQQSTFEMWWNERFTSWMCRRQICSNCVMLSWQYDQHLWEMFPTSCWIYATKN